MLKNDNELASAGSGWTDVELDHLSIQSGSNQRPFFSSSALLASIAALFSSRHFAALRSLFAARNDFSNRADMFVPSALASATRSASIERFTALLLAMRFSMRNRDAHLKSGQG